MRWGVLQDSGCAARNAIRPLAHLLPNLARVSQHKLFRAGLGVLYSSNIHLVLNFSQQLEIQGAVASVCADVLQYSLCFVVCTSGVFHKKRKNQPPQGSFSPAEEPC